MKQSRSLRMYVEDRRTGGLVLAHVFITVESVGAGDSITVSARSAAGELDLSPSEIALALDGL